MPLTNITLNLKQSGNKIEGNLKGEGGITGKIKATIDGDTVEFKLRTPYLSAMEGLMVLLLY